MNHKSILWLFTMAVLAVLPGCVASENGDEAVSGQRAAVRGSLDVAGGTGTVGDPWMLASCEQLRSIDLERGGHFALAGDIDCTSVGFDALGDRGGFRGSLDGRGYSITGVQVDSSGPSGLFARTRDALIQNLHVAIEVDGHSQVGGLIGTAHNTIVQEVGVEGHVNGGGQTGGLIGHAVGGRIINSFAQIDVTCTASCGALVGHANNTVSIEQSYAVVPQAPTLVGSTGPHVVVEGAFHDCEVSGGCSQADHGATTAQLQSTTFLESQGWDMNGIWGFRGWPEYPCHRFQDECGVVRVSVDPSVVPEPTHEDYQGTVLHEIARLELDGDGFDFYVDTFVLESYPDQIGEILVEEGLEILEVDEPESWDDSPFHYLVRPLPSAEPCGDELVNYLRQEEPGLDGHLVFSEEAARRTFCVFLRLTNRGHLVDLDAPMDADTYTRGSSTVTTGRARSKNVIDWADFGMRYGISYGIPQAWEALDAFGRTPHVSANVADEGFARHTDFNGEGGEDFVPLRDMFDANGNGPLQRHGASCAAVLSATPDNDWGVVGTSGRFAERTVLWGIRNQWQIRRAMRHARRQNGASILSISYSVDTPRRLRVLRRGMNRTASISFRGNLLIFASASNDGVQLDNSLARMPCEADHVQCVGGLATNSLSIANNTSNWGSPVDIFAPYQGPGFPASAIPTDAIGFFNGTSYSTPYVAGVATLVWTADPSLDPQGVVDILRDTARTSSVDPRVTRVVNPYEAVIAALPSRPPLTQIGLTTVFEDSSLDVGQLAFFPGSISTTGGISSISWTSSRRGLLGTSLLLFWTPTAEDVGSHIIELSATDANGLTTSEAFEVVVVNNNSVPVISDILSTPEPYVAGETVTLSASVFDAEGDPLTYAWSASDDPAPFDWRPLGSGTTLMTTSLTALTGTWIRLVVTDRVGNVANRIEFIPAVNSGVPSLTGAIVTYLGTDEFGGNFLRLDVTATDPEDGIIPDSSIEWFVDASTPGTIPYTGNHTTILYYTSESFCNNIPSVVVSARDSGGNVVFRLATVVGC